ncbi:MAG: S41 family peptidase [Elusimicrobiales bacterium]|nr:S41 family peptidase [Elusimicrobiales bacterium]
MKKLLLPFFLLLAACSEKSLYPDALKAFEKHSYKEYPAAQVREALESKGFAGLAALDRNARLVKAARRVRTRPSQELVSGGALLDYRRGGVYAAKVFRDSPAAEAGLRDGDRILEIDGLPATPQAVAERIPDSFGFTLKALRAGPRGPVPVKAEVHRGKFVLPLVFGFYEPASGTAYVKVGLFVQGSSATTVAGLEALTALGAKKLVLDLRGNGGGVPEEAAGLLGAFAPKAGPVLELKSRHKGYSRLYEAGARGKFAGLRMAVLVDGATSMAAETFAQALRELSGASIVGANTGGRVSLLRSFRMGRGGKGLELTVARLFPPSGLDLEEKGVAPDLKVELTPEQEKDLLEAWDAASETVLLGDRAYLKAMENFSK